MELDGSLPLPKAPATCPCPEPEQSSPCHHTTLPEDPIYYIIIIIIIIIIIVLPSMPRSFEWSPLLEFPTKNLYAPLMSLYM